jgi:hypothetical protein
MGGATESMEVRAPAPVAAILRSQLRYYDFLSSFVVGGGWVVVGVGGGVVVVVAVVVELFSFTDDLKLRIPSPRALPNSPSFLGPKISRTITRITSRCIGANSPLSTETSVKTARCIQGQATGSTFLSEF